MHAVGGIAAPLPNGMVNPISVRELQETPLERSAAPVSFSSVLGQFVGEISDKQAIAGETVNGLLAGSNVSLHQAMIAMEEASVSFQLMVEVRNKLLESYQELMRMQI